MGAVKRILLADSNEMFREELQQQIGEIAWLQIVGIAEDGAETVRLLEQLQPDLLLLDLMLAQVDGLKILSQLAQISPGTACIVASGFLNDVVAAEVAAFGARYLIRKPCDVSWLVERICSLWQWKPLPDKAEQRPMVSWVLKRSCVPLHLTGFPLLVEAVCLALQEPQLREGIIKQLYPTVAKRCNTTAGGAERAIRLCISKAWEQGMAEMLERCFCRKLSKRPTNNEFIALIVELVRETSIRGFWTM